MKPRNLLLIIVLAVFGIMSTGAQESATFTINPDEERGEISPYVYGANYSAYGFVNFELFELAANSGITFLRYPGGDYADKATLTTDMVDAYMQTVKIMDVEPTLGVGIVGKTPQEAADMVRHTNIDNDYNITYWYIGNEPTLYTGFYGDEHGAYNVDRYNEEWRAIALAMREVDPDIKFVAPEPNNWNGDDKVQFDDNGVDWIKGFLEVNADLVDVVAVHYYPFPKNSTGSETTTIEDLRQNTLKFDNIIPNLRAVVEEVTGRTDIPVAVTEANSHWSKIAFGEATPDSHFNAIWWTNALGKMIDDQAFMVAYFDIQSNDSRGGWGMLNKYDPRPSYFVYQLYQRFGDMLIASESDDQFMSVVASTRDDGTLTVIATNLYDDERTAVLNIGEGYSTVSEAYLLDPEHNADLVEVGTLYADGTLTLPAHSAILLVIPQDG